MTIEDIKKIIGQKERQRRRPTFLQSTPPPVSQVFAYTPQATSLSKYRRLWQKPRPKIKNQNPL